MQAEGKNQKSIRGGGGEIRSLSHPGEDAVFQFLLFNQLPLAAEGGDLGATDRGGISEDGEKGDCISIV